MTTRIDENNIVDYLHNFNKKHIRQTKHSNTKRKDRKFPIEFIIITLTEKYPIIIKQKKNKKFALVYPYTQEYNLNIVISIKDKYINIVTQYIFNKKRKI